MNTSLEKSPTFAEMFTKERVEALTPPLADYISMSAAPFAISDTLLGTRDEVRKLLANLQDRCHGDNMLQSQVSIAPVPKEHQLISRQITALIEQIDIGVVSPRGRNASLAFSPSSLSLSQMQSPTSYHSSLAFSPGSSSKLNPLSITMARPRRKARSRSAFERQLPLLRRLTGDFTAANEKKDKDVVWKQGIVTAESTRFAKTVLDRYVFDTITPIFSSDI
jgi:hypothetical protein